MRKRLAALCVGAALAAVPFPADGASAAPPNGDSGYYLVAADGGVFAFGSAPFYGSAAPYHLAAPVVGIATDLHGDGYWLAGRDGGVFSFGNAPFLGSAVGLLGSPVVGIATLSGGGYEGGYVLAAANGTTVTFNPGSAPTAQKPPEGMHGAAVALDTSATASGAVALVTARGQVVPGGPAVANIGDPSSEQLAQPVVGIALGGANGNQYQLVAADGGVFCYGIAFSGSAGGEHLAAPVVGTALVGNGSYYLAAADGGVFSYGDARFYGSAAGTNLAAPVVGIALP